MALSSRKSVFGVHSVAAYNPSTLEPYGVAKVIGSISLGFSGEVIPLLGGSSAFPWRVETGAISTEISLTLREYPNFLYDVFLGQEVTDGSAEANGGVDTITNIGGTSVVSATTGIASVGVKSGSEADVKSGIYVVKAASSTTVDVYALTDVDFAKGTDLTFVDDSLKITSSALTISTSTAVTIPSIGLELTGGSGTIGMTTGDTAFFSARAQNTGYQTAVIGQSNFTFKDVGLVCAAQKAGDGAVYLIDLYRAKGAGMPINMTEKAFSEAEISVQAFYDADRNGVFRMLRVQDVV